MPKEHGAPLRLVIPQMYGYKGVKWLTEVHATNRAAARLLGAARLRHRRLGGPLQWPWLSARPAPAPCARFGAHRAGPALGERAGLRRRSPLTGLVLWLPVLATLVNDRPLVKAVHLWSAVLLGIAIVLIVVGGNRRALRRTARDVDRFDRYDRAWLRGAPRRALRGGEAPPAGRFNAGQKLNVVVVCAAWLLFGVSGTFLYLGERDHTFQLGGMLFLHDVLTLAMLPLVFGHIYMAVLNPNTAGGLRGHDPRLGRRATGRSATTPAGIRTPAPATSARARLPRRGDDARRRRGRRPCAGARDRARTAAPRGRGAGRRARGRALRLGRREARRRQRRRRARCWATRSPASCWTARCRPGRAWPSPTTSAAAPARAACPATRRRAWPSRRPACDPGGFAERLVASAAHVASTVLPLPDEVADADGALVEPLACVRARRRVAARRAAALVVGCGAMGLLFCRLLRAARPRRRGARSRRRAAAARAGGRRAAGRRGRRGRLLRGHASGRARRRAARCCGRAGRACSSPPRRSRARSTSTASTAPSSCCAGRGPPRPPRCARRSS